MRTLKSTGAGWRRGGWGRSRERGAVRSTGLSVARKEVARKRMIGRGCQTPDTADCRPMTISPDEQMRQQALREGCLKAPGSRRWQGCDPGRAAAEWDKTTARP